MIPKKDYIIAAFIGFLAGVFLIPTAYQLHLSSAAGVDQRVFLSAIPLLTPFVFLAGMGIAVFLARYLAFMRQLARFAAVGILNTAIDFGVLNILSGATGITAGFIVGGVNMPGFLIAVFNSYFWNKLWVFEDRGEKNVFQDFPKFLAVTVIGIIINSGIVILVTTFVAPWGGVAAQTWLNIAKVAATLISLVWNFLGYKFFVFQS
jgi:putative flippase GtrA